MVAMFVYVCVSLTGSQLIWKHEGCFSCEGENEERRREVVGERRRGGD